MTICMPWLICVFCNKCFILAFFWIFYHYIICVIQRILLIYYMRSLKLFYSIYSISSIKKCNGEVQVFRHKFHFSLNKNIEKLFNKILYCFFNFKFSLNKCYALIKFISHLKFLFFPAHFPSTIYLEVRTLKKSIFQSISTDGLCWLSNFLI